MFILKIIVFLELFKSTKFLLLYLWYHFLFRDFNYRKQLFPSTCTYSIFEETVCLFSAICSVNRWFRYLRVCVWEPNEAPSGLYYSASITWVVFTQQALPSGLLIKAGKAIFETKGNVLLFIIISHLLQKS